LPWRFNVTATLKRAASAPAGVRLTRSQQAILPARAVPVALFLRFGFCDGSRAIVVALDIRGQDIKWMTTNCDSRLHSDCIHP
jgi:hypothetical protein